MIRRLAPLVVLASLALPTAVAEAKTRSFHTPSQNIACMYVSHIDARGAYLRCDVYSLNDTAFTLRRRGRGHRVHVTDAVGRGAGRELAYGDSVTYGPFKCTSRLTGLTCRSKPSGHGFKLSRASQTVF
jgi:hypothetical protein